MSTPPTQLQRRASEGDLQNMQASFMPAGGGEQQLQLNQQVVQKLEEKNKDTLRKSQELEKEDPTTPENEEGKELTEAQKKSMLSVVVSREKRDEIKGKAKETAAPVVNQLTEFKEALFGVPKNTDEKKGEKKESSEGASKEEKKGWTDTFKEAVGPTLTDVKEAIVGPEHKELNPKPEPKPEFKEGLGQWTGRMLTFGYYDARPKEEGDKKTNT